MKKAAVSMGPIGKGAGGCGEDTAGRRLTPAAHARHPCFPEHLLSPGGLGEAGLAAGIDAARSDYSGRRWICQVPLGSWSSAHVPRLVGLQADGGACGASVDSACRPEGGRFPQAQAW